MHVFAHPCMSKYVAFYGKWVYFKRNKFGHFNFVILLNADQCLDMKFAAFEENTFL